MRLSGFLERVASAALRRPVAVVASVAVLGAVGGVLALRLHPETGIDTLINRGSDTFQATDRYHRMFGDDAVLVLVRGPLPDLVLTQDVERLLGMEGCISGNAPVGVKIPGGPNGPCGRLARSKPVQVVYGPGTFINEAVRELQVQFARRQQVEAQRERGALTAARKLAAAKGLGPAEQDRLAKEARQLVRAQYVRDTLKIALTYGIRSVPRLNDPDFVSSLVFDASRGATVPKARFAYLFPNPNTALVQVRLKPGLSDSQRDKAINQIRDATKMKQWSLRHGEKPYVVTGAPVVLSALTTRLKNAILTLLVASLLVMAATLALVFRSRPRLLPLGIALVTAGVLFGGMQLVGVSLTMASVAVLPVLIGLVVDYSIQLQSRYDEAAADLEEGAPAARRAAARGGPAITAAAAATAAGFLALLVSPVPMVRGFGVLLVVGIALGFACALTAGLASVVLLRGRPRSRQAPRRLKAPAAWLAGARDLVAGVVRPIGRSAAVRDLPGRVLAQANARPVRVLGIGVALAVVGLALGTQTRTVSDIPKLVPQDLPALRDLTALQKATGVSGEVDVTVAAPDLTQPRVIAWMTAYQQRLLRRYGYTTRHGCGKAQLCPALSLPDLFRSGTGGLSQPRVKALLDAVPPYFSQAVITPDRKVATLAFGIRLMPLDRQQKVIDDMRSSLHPPPGVHAELAGLPVVAADANAQVSSQWRRLATLLAGLIAVGLTLMLFLRSARRALVPLIPIVLATGWAALVLFAVRISLNPMSVTLGALVVAISTEFSVLLAERYRQERAAGLGVERALQRTYRSTGAAVLASATTATAGFAVLIVSSIRMLRDFGAAAVVDLVATMVGLLVVLPAVLVLEERGELYELPLRALRRVWRLVPLPRRVGAG